MELNRLLHHKGMKAILFLSILFFSCKNVSDTDLVHKAETTEVINTQGRTIETRFNAPQGFTRTEVSPKSFAYYLRTLPLQPSGKQVQLYNGQLKSNQSAHAAVVKMDVGTQDLQQCADAVMRLRAEYLFAQKRYDELHFNFTNGFNAQFSTWKNGKGIAVNGNKVSWKSQSSNNGSYASFRKYLTKVFMFAGTASLEKELKPKSIRAIEIGDVFIRGGHPGHAVIVVDMCKDEHGGKAFMLAQSYMPAQEIQILKNPMNDKISPWYIVADLNEMLETPEWDFALSQLRAFE